MASKNKSEVSSAATKVAKGKRRVRGAAKEVASKAAKAVTGTVKGTAKAVGGTAKGTAKLAKSAAKASKSAASKLSKAAQQAIPQLGASKKKLSPEEFTKRALDFHKKPRPGKIEVKSTRTIRSDTDLSLAYSPGVALPCLEIEHDPAQVYNYTNKGNLVGIISNGTAVLGLGDIGPAASKPVMEGKAMLFKLFANVDVFDIEVRTRSVERFIETVTDISPTFGAINLEDIAAPDCFQIEERLKQSLNIPILHDDQSGTAVVACAALRNAMEIQNKKLCDVKLVCIGAGAAGIGILNLCREFFGISLEQFYLFDSQGLVTIDRPQLSTYKVPYAKPATGRDELKDVIRGADILIGVSKKNLISQSMVSSMASNPIIMAMANPDPEILPEKVNAVRSDAIVATGRSDYPNQVNNSVCFPYLFRGALDAQAKKFTPAMLHAAVSSLSNLARKDIPSSVKRAMRIKSHSGFGRNYILPRQNDPRLLGHIAPAVCNAYDEKDIGK